MYRGQGHLEARSPETHKKMGLIFLYSLWEIGLHESGRTKANNQQAHEKMLPIADHTENANQNHNELFLTPVRMAIVSKTRGNKW